MDRDESTGVVSVTNHREFDSFGNLVSETNAAVDHVFGFTGRYFDEASGLQNNWNRWYDAEVGQWVSEDPIGFRAGDTNLRRYVSNAVAVGIDPDGLEGYLYPWQSPGNSGYYPGWQKVQKQEILTGKAAVNGSATAVKSTITLGYKTEHVEIFSVTKEERESIQYRVESCGYQALSELLLGFGVGKAAQAPGKFMPKAALFFDFAGNTNQVVIGIGEGNPVKAGLGAIGVSGNLGGRFPTSVPGLIVVSHWGPPGMTTIRTDDWVMVGPPTYYNYVLSGTWQPGRHFYWPSNCVSTTVDTRFCLKTDLGVLPEIEQAQAWMI